MKRIQQHKGVVGTIVVNNEGKPIILFINLNKALHAGIENDLSRRISQIYRSNTAIVYILLDESLSTVCLLL